MYGYRMPCKSKAEFMIFGDDGKPYMSRFEGCVCAKHLAGAIRRFRARQAAGTDNRTAIASERKTGK